MRLLRMREGSLEIRGLKYLQNNRAISSTHFLLALIAILLTILVYQNYRRETEGTQFHTPYQAVLLLSGQAYFGKLENFGSPYPVLTDVYYVQNQVNQETKQVTNTLVKRGKEWHEPDRMVLNARQIVFVEPVTPGSQLAKLIEDLKKKGQ
jgi:hypothetical protein